MISSNFIVKFLAILLLFSLTIYGEEKKDGKEKKPEEKCPEITDKEPCDKEPSCAYNPMTKKCIANSKRAKELMEKCYKEGKAFDMDANDCINLKDYCKKQEVETCFNGTFGSCVFEARKCIALDDSCAKQKDPNYCISQCIWSILDKKCVAVEDYCEWSASNGQLPCETLWMCKWSEGKCLRKYEGEPDI